MSFSILFTMTLTGCVRSHTPSGLDGEISLARLAIFIFTVIFDKSVHGSTSSITVRALSSTTASKISSCSIAVRLMTGLITGLTGASVANSASASQEYKPSILREIDAIKAANKYIFFIIIRSLN